LLERRICGSTPFGALDHCTNVASCTRRFASGQPLLDLSDPQQQVELVAQLGAHHLRAVGGDRERHLWLKKAQMVSRAGLLVGERPVLLGRADSSTLGPAGLGHQVPVLGTRRPSSPTWIATPSRESASWLQRYLPDASSHVASTVGSP
jgi:hypothetical protein